MLSGASFPSLPLTSPGPNWHSLAGLGSHSKAGRSMAWPEAVVRLGARAAHLPRALLQCLLLGGSVYSLAVLHLHIFLHAQGRFAAMRARDVPVAP